MIADVDSIRGGGSDDEDEDEDEPPVKKPVKPVAKKQVVEDEDEDDPKPTRRGFGKKGKNDAEDDNPLPKAKKVVKKDPEEDDSPLPKAKKVVKKPEPKPKRKVAARDDEDDEDDDEAIEDEVEVAGLAGAAAVSPAERSIELVAGLSFTARRMSFRYEASLGDKPPPYNGVPVAGVLIDATIFPLAIGHSRSGGMGKNFGVTVMYDKVLRINSRQGDPPVTLPTEQSRYAFGAAFRYPLGALTLGATLRYGKQNFTISPNMGVTPSLPSVEYTVIDPMATVKYQLNKRIILNANLGFMVITGTGPIQSTMNYGASTVTGFEGELGADYMLTTNIFTRAAFRFQTIGYSFKGTGMLSTGRDSDPEQDVFGARDNYIGGAVTVGVLY